MYVVHTENMELNDVLLILGVFFPLFFVSIWQLNRLNPNKKANKAGDSSIKELYSVYNNQVNDVLKIKDKVIASLQAKLRNFEEEEEEEPDNGVKPVTWEEITALVNSTYPKYVNLLPLVKKQVMDATKGMTIQEILQYVKQFTGNKQSEGTSTPESITYNPNWA